MTARPQNGEEVGKHLYVAPRGPCGHSAVGSSVLGRLPRGNQADVAQAITRRGLTTRQATRLVDRLLGAPDEAARMRLLAEAESPAAPRARARTWTPAEAIIADASVLAARASRLHARLLERPLATLGPDAAALVAVRLGELRPILQVLGRTLGEVLHA